MMNCKIIGRFVFGIFIIFLIGLSWFTLSVVDNHEKLENCSWNPHESHHRYRMPVSPPK